MYQKICSRKSFELCKKIFLIGDFFEKERS